MKKPPKETVLKKTNWFMKCLYEDYFHNCKLKVIKIIWNFNK